MVIGDVSYAKRTRILNTPTQIRLLLLDGARQAEPSCSSGCNEKAINHRAARFTLLHRFELHLIFLPVGSGTTHGARLD